MSSRTSTADRVVAPLRAWRLAARPVTLWAAVAPVVVGSAVAQAAGGLRPLRALGALGVALLVQLGTNFANDLFDYRKGADTAERLGPIRAVQAGLIAPRQMAVGTAAAMSLAALVGLYLAAVAGWWLLVVGAAAILAGLAYTGGPLPLGYHGLGDLFVLLFFGLVAVCGTVYVQLGTVPELAWFAALGVGCLTTAILVVNNVRDVDTDRKAGKRTLAVLLGARAATAELVALLAIAYALPYFLMAARLSRFWILLVWLSGPLAVGLLHQVFTRRGAELNSTLASAARLLLVYSVLLSLGILLGAGS